MSTWSMHPDEAAALVPVSERLGRRFPAWSPQEIHQLLTRIHRQFDDSTVRNFIPILVEREAVEILRSHRATALTDTG